VTGWLQTPPRGRVAALTIRQGAYSTQAAVALPCASSSKSSESTSRLPGCVLVGASQPAAEALAAVIDSTATSSRSEIAPRPARQKTRSSIRSLTAFLDDPKPL